MEHVSEISLRQAAVAFGPCAGGTDNALRQIIDKLEDDETFWRKFVVDKTNMRSDIIAMESSDWFRNYSSLSSQHPVGMDAEFDEFRTAVEHTLFETDDLVMDYDEVRSIWFPQDFAQFIPNAELATTWSFTQALAWVATKDLGIVGAIDHLSSSERIGWLAVLLSERCEKCDLLAGNLRWQQCHCLTNAFASLCSLHGHKDASNNPAPKLEISAENGAIKASRNSWGLEFNPADLCAIFRLADSAIVAPSNKKGAKVITDEAKELWLQRRRSGHRALSKSNEAKVIHKLLTERHKGSNMKVPTAGTIRKRITDWLIELGEVE